MKALFVLFLTSLLSVTAFASQKISCRQVSKDGSFSSKGLEVTVSMTSKAAGTASVRGMKDDSLSKLTVHTVNQGTAVDGSKYTTIFLLPKLDDGMLDIQLQFSAIVIGQNFSNLKANYVIGSEDANPETGFAFGYDMICSGKVL